MADRVSTDAPNPALSEIAGLLLALLCVTVLAPSIALETVYQRAQGEFEE